MRAMDCEVCAEGRAAMDAGNEMGPEGAASLASVLEKMTQLTALNLGGARARFGRGSDVGGLCVFGARFWGSRLDAMCCGWGTGLRAGDAGDGLRGGC
jgi:hypothetical protein